MSRTYRDFTWTNEDGYDGLVQMSWGPWGDVGDSASHRDAPIMLSFEDATWMGVEAASDFQRWLRSALAEAKRMHVPRHEVRE